MWPAELVRDDNPLPVQIRKDVLTLSVFINKRIIDVMAHQEPEKQNIIIDINCNLAACCAVTRRLKSMTLAENKGNDG